MNKRLISRQLLNTLRKFARHPFVLVIFNVRTPLKRVEKWNGPFPKQGLLIAKRDGSFYGFKGKIRLKHPLLNILELHTYVRNHFPGVAPNGSHLLL